MKETAATNGPEGTVLKKSRFINPSRPRDTSIVQEHCSNQRRVPLKRSAETSAETETAMKELVEKYRPVGQRSVRSETTKDNAGVLPPAVYADQSADCTKVDLEKEAEE